MNVAEDYDDSFSDFMPQKVFVRTNKSQNVEADQKEKKRKKALKTLSQTGRSSKRSRKEGEIFTCSQELPSDITSSTEEASREEQRSAVEQESCSGVNDVSSITSKVSQEVISEKEAKLSCQNSCANDHSVSSSDVPEDSIDHRPSLVSGSQECSQMSGEESEEKWCMLWTCIVCKRSIPEQLKSVHLSECIKTFKHQFNSKVSTSDPEEVSPFMCDICKANITHLTFSERSEHMNRCLDSPAESGTDTSSGNSVATPATYVITECPLCLKNCSSAEARFAHVKKCSRAMGINVQSVITALQLQAQHTAQRIALGLPLVSASSRNRPSAPRSSARVIKEIRKPKSKADADIQLAKALSLSIEEEKKQNLSDLEEIELEDNYVPVHLRPPDVAQRPGRKKKKKGEKPVPFLLLQTEEARQKLLEERVSAIISYTDPVSDKQEQNGTIEDPAASQSMTSDNPVSVSSVNEHTCRLWHLNGLAAEKLDYYVPELLEFVSVCDIEAGSKLRSLSQVPGHHIFTQKPCDFTFSATQLSDPSPSSVIPSTQEMVDIMASQAVRAENSQVDVSEVDAGFHLGQDNSGGFIGEGKAPEPQLNPVINCLESVVGNMFMSDVDISLAEDENIPAHKLILLLRCPSLREELCNTDGRLQLDWSDVSREVAWHFLYFVYTGCKNWPPSLNNEVLTLAARFGMKNFSNDDCKGNSGSCRYNNDLVDDPPQATEAFDHFTVDGSDFDASIASPVQFEFERHISSQAVSVEQDNCSSGLGNEDKTGKHHYHQEIKSSKKHAQNALDGTSVRHDHKEQSTGTVSFVNTKASPGSSDSVQSISDLNCTVVSRQEDVTMNIKACDTMTGILTEDHSLHEHRSYALNDNEDMNSTMEHEAILNHSRKLEYSKNSGDDYLSIKPVESDSVERDETVVPLYSADSESVNVTERFFPKLDQKLIFDQSTVLAPTSWDDKSSTVLSTAVSDGMDRGEETLVYPQADSNPALENAGPDSPTPCHEEVTLIFERKSRVASPLGKELLDSLQRLNAERESSPDLFSWDDDEGCSFIKESVSTSHCAGDDDATGTDALKPYFSNSKNDNELLENKESSVVLKSDTIRLSQTNCESPILLSSDTEDGHDEDLVADIGLNVLAENQDNIAKVSPRNAESPEKSETPSCEKIVKSLMKQVSDGESSSPLPSPSKFNAQSSDSEEELLPLHVRIARLMNKEKENSVAEQKVLVPSAVVDVESDDDSCDLVNFSQIAPAVVAGSDSPITKTNGRENRFQKITGNHLMSDATVPSPKSHPSSLSFGAKMSDSPVTPLPNFKSMVTPDIKEALKKYGIRPLPRKKAVAVLTHIYDEIHPYVENGIVLGNDTGTGSSQTGRGSKPTTQKRTKDSPAKKNSKTNKSEKQNKKVKLDVVISPHKIPTEGEVSKEIHSSSQTSSQSDLSDVLEESLFAYGDEGTSSQQFESNANAQENVRSYIMQNKQLYNKILMYEPLNLMEFQQELKQVGIKISTNDLMNFFDEQCITFTMPRNEKYQKKQQARNQNFRKRMIAKLSQAPS